MHPGDLGKAELDRWREIQERVPELHNPFLAPGFTLAVGAARASARVAVMEDAGRIVGFFPYERRGMVIGKPIGAGISDCQAVIHEPGVDWRVGQLLRACRLPVWEFDHLLADQRQFWPYHTVQTSSLIMDLSGGYDAYLAERKQATRASFTKMFQKRRKMAKDLGPLRLAYDIPPDDHAPMETLKAWKSRQYRRTGHFDRFATPWIVKVVDRLRQSTDPECRGTLTALYAGDRLIAADFGLRGRGVLAGWFTAYDPEIRTYGPGIHLITMLAEAAAADGVRYVDMGKGESEFKARLCSWKLPLAEGRVVRSRAVAVVRQADLSLRQRLHAARMRGSEGPVSDGPGREGPVSERPVSERPVSGGTIPSAQVPRPRREPSTVTDQSGRAPGSRAA